MNPSGNEETAAIYHIASLFAAFRRRLLAGLERKREGNGAVSEKSLLERVTATAEERHLSQKTLTAYRRIWLKLIWTAAGEFCEEVTPLSQRIALPPGKSGALAFPHRISKHGGGPAATQLRPLPLQARPVHYYRIGSPNSPASPQGSQSPNRLVMQRRILETSATRAS